jgi:uncharacterized membrane protein YwaF
MSTGDISKTEDVSHYSTYLPDTERHKDFINNVYPIGNLSCILFCNCKLWLRYVQVQWANFLLYFIVHFCYFLDKVYRFLFCRGHYACQGELQSCLVIVMREVVFPKLTCQILPTCPCLCLHSIQLKCY